MFCDASKRSYGIAAYLRKFNDTESSNDLIFSKTRVAPLKPLTIPRLELMAAYLGAIVISFLRQESPFTMSSTHLWSDSTTVLQWLDSNKKLPPFVHNRVSSICKVPDVEYNYIRSPANPAHLPSRGTSTSDLLSNDLWWHGPDTQTQSTVLVGEGSADAESLETSCEAGTSQMQIKMPFDIDITRYSSFDALVRVSAFCCVLCMFAYCAETKE